MIKYYYDDPLAAAWMYVKFGMEYSMPRHPDAKLLPYSMMHHIDSRTLSNVVEFENKKTKFHVHPDSLHLLEAQDDDWVFYQGLPGKIVLYRGKLTVDNCWGQACEFNDKYFGGIIQRNGIPFMRPKESA